MRTTVPTPRQSHLRIRNRQDSRDAQRSDWRVELRKQHSVDLGEWVCFCFGFYQSSILSLGAYLTSNLTPPPTSNSEFDPWRSASVSSEIRPGGPLQSTLEVPVYLLPNAVHCNDLSVRNAQANEDLRKAHEGMIKTMAGWVDDFYEERGVGRPGGPYRVVKKKGAKVL